MRSIVFILLFVASQALGQSYTAIHVMGKIYLPDRQEYLKRGTKILETENLEFQSVNAKAAMLSSARGRYVIQPGSKSISTNNLAFALSSVITPVKGQMSTRAGSINNALDFEKQLGEAPVAWLNEELSFEVSSNAYPIDEDKFFYLAYTYQNETINKKLSNEDQSLKFVKSEVYRVDDQPVASDAVSDMELYYYDTQKGEAQLVVKPQLVNVTPEELSTLRSSVGEGSTSELLEFINSLYGKCSVDELEQAMTSAK
ncbi:MAG: hypothetical protein RIF33_24215 [Cyclobacteriaceae bacterium]